MGPLFISDQRKVMSLDGEDQTTTDMRKHDEHTTAESVKEQQQRSNTKRDESSNNNPPEESQLAPPRQQHHHHHHHAYPFLRTSSFNNNCQGKLGRMLTTTRNSNNCTNKRHHYYYYPNHHHQSSNLCFPNNGLIMPSDQDHHHQQDHGIMHNNILNNSHNPNLRKYIVLLQDCLAVKFLPAGHHHSAIPFAFDQGNSATASNNQEHSSPPPPSHANISSSVPPTAGSAAAAVSTTTINAAGLLGGGSGSGTTEVDHSLHGLYLYKAFREANLKCYWNTGMCDAIRSLEYKGYIVPSTILVFSSNPRHLNVLRTAWSRRILRHPPGYRLDLLGEVEEIVAQPVQQGQFAPLSDSLCWAILELTSTGQEAFVDSIMIALQTAFPAMSQPPKELVYQTLEKLIREQKIYQTSHGYYIVTPDVSTFMNSRSATPAPPPPFHSPPFEPLNPNYCDLDKISLSQHSWGSAASVLDAEELLFRRASSKLPLKRHNSLKIIRQRDRDLDIPRPHMGARSLSFRLSKGNSLFDSDKEEDEDEEEEDDECGGGQESSGHHKSETDNNVQTPPCSTTMPQQQQPEKQKKKRRSFFRRWFSFRLLRPSKNRVEGANKAIQLEELTRSPRLYSCGRIVRSSTNTISTQTKATTTRSIESLNTLEQQHTLKGSKSKWNSLPSANNRLPYRRSILDEASPFYDTLRSGRENQHVHSSRYSTRSSSLGYGSQNNGTGGVMPNGEKEIIEEMSKFTRRRHFSGTTMRTASPCPSSSVSAIYASIANNNSARESPGVMFNDKYCRHFPGHHHHQYNQEFPRPYHGPCNSRQNPPPVLLRHNNSTTRQANINRPKSAYELFTQQKEHHQGQVPIKPRKNKCMDQRSSSSVISTTVTQNVKSTTSTELNVTLPIGKLVTASISTTKNDSSKNTPNSSATKQISVDIGAGSGGATPEDHETGTQLTRVRLTTSSQPTTTETNINTLISNNNKLGGGGGEASADDDESITPDSSDVSH